MAGTSFYHNHGAKENAVTEIFAKIAIGASGAATLNVAASKGVTSVTKNDTGDYTLLLSEAYPSLLMVDVTLLSTADTDLTSQVLAEDVLVAKTVKIGVHAGATPAHPPSGSTLYVRVTVKNSSV